MIGCANPLAQFRSHRDGILQAVREVLEGDSYILGKAVARFEREFADYCGVSHAIGVNSGTDALVLALRALGVGAGDEVVTVSHTALATVAAVIASGATPVLADVDPVYYTIDPASLQAAITPRTKAIVAVHLYGQMADMREILRIAQARNLPVIEDCAQATGAAYEGKRAGSLGDVGCFSFYPTKNLGAIGDGGMVIARDAALADRVRRLRQYGWNAQRQTEEPGLNSRLDEIQAAILSIKLSSLDADNARRAEIARRYDAALAGMSVTPPAARKRCTHVYHLYVIACEGRDGLKERMHGHGVMAGVHYPVPAHLHGGYGSHVVCPPGGLPVTESLVQRILTLPLYPELTDVEVDQVIDAVKRCHV